MSGVILRARPPNSFTSLHACRTVDENEVDTSGCAEKTLAPGLVVGGSVVLRLFHAWGQVLLFETFGHPLRTGTDVRTPGPAIWAV